MSEMRKFNIKVALLVIAIVVVVLGGWYLWGPAGTPPGQPPLTSLSPQNFKQLTSQFDQAAGDERLVLLLSPT